MKKLVMLLGLSLCLGAVGCGSASRVKATPDYGVKKSTFHYAPIAPERVDSFVGASISPKAISSILRRNMTRIVMRDFSILSMWSERFMRAGTFSYHPHTPFSLENRVGGRERVRHHRFHGARYCRGFDTNYARHSDEKLQNTPMKNSKTLR